MIAAFDELLGRQVSMRAMALLRVLVGPIVLLHLRPFLTDAWHGQIYRDTFYEPYASWYPELPTPLYVAVLCVGALAAVAMTVGSAHASGDRRPCSPSSPTTCSCRRRTCTTTAPTSSSCSPPSP